MVTAYFGRAARGCGLLLWMAAQLQAQMASGPAGCGTSVSMAPVVDGANAEAALSILNRTTPVSTTRKNEPLSDDWNEQVPASNDACGNGACDCGDAFCYGGASCTGNLFRRRGLNRGCTDASAMICENHLPGCGCNMCRGRLMGFELFGEYLYLRPRNTEVPYAVPIDGPITPVQGNGIQIGDTRLTDIEHHGNFRIGFNAVSTICGRLTGQWAHFESRDTDSLSIDAPDVIRSLVTHPLGLNAASDGLETSASQDIDFDLVDLALQSPIYRGPCWSVDWLAGLRYGQLSQQFSSIIAVNGQTFVDTDISFNGLGPRVGVHAQRNLGFGTLYVFNRSEASFLVGTFDANYQQSDAFSGVVVNTGWEAGRIVPQLEMEMGVGCGTPGGRLQLRAGYMVSAWFNTVTSSEFISAVQQNNTNNLGDGISFDGLVIRSEIRF